MLDSAIFPYSADLREQILAVAGSKAISVAELADLDEAIALQFATAAKHLASQGMLRRVFDYSITLHVCHSDVRRNLKGMLRYASQGMLRRAFATRNDKTRMIVIASGRGGEGERTLRH